MSHMQQGSQILIHATQPLLEFFLLPLEFADFCLRPPQLFLGGYLFAAATFYLFIIIHVVHPVIFVHLLQRLRLLLDFGLIVSQGAPAVCVFDALCRYPLQRPRQRVYSAKLLGTLEQYLDVYVVFAATPLGPPDLFVEVAS